ncbi:hypothetical protein AYO21_02829 [Fonsecaea monophora]|uniref:DUF7053 domain-containing protein n=2 Tax=Fonsecaea TaxID=40354 RepID=A0A0D2GZ56_9EURO|nr:uncharacterized protein Z517_01734 [Fonsecaea pedrosoi CBS 271.37]XP_022514830.1 hypothetical protein AYO21_02829 [Fonsecaea monophora]KAH0848625.1 hypothetical protein FOPE_02672 [Fonsecaea pedrosoi]KIW86338.1 hypothetical protein Z517_01734 [Fonsecaea pedrosoi CBS 271.37]OAG42878.1 hypothetical protein AYO21_02829 [Fonsecaea monophora]
MAFMQTSFKSGWITDLVLPAPPEGKSPQDVLDAGYELALKMCTDPILMAQLNPLVNKVVNIPASDPKAVDHKAMCKDFKVDLNADYAAEDFQHYAITDKLNVIPGYSTDLTYYSAIRRTKDGMEALTNPGSGVTIYGRFTIRIAEPRDVKALDASDGKGWVVNFYETNELRCNVMLSYYIRATTDKSHRTAHGRFKEMWYQGMKDMGYPSTS